MREVLAALALSSACCACRDEGAAQRAAATASALPAAPATGAPPPSTPSALPHALVEPRASAGCRVLAVRGAAAGVERGAPVDGRRWLDLAAGVEVALKHGTTTREWTLRGPGRFLACANGEEVVHTARGSVETTPGAGTRAGAEVTLGTPFATIRYADAKLLLEVSEEELVLAVSQGAATLEAVDTKAGSGVAPARSVSGPKGRAVVAGSAEPARLAERCSAATAGAETRAARPGAIPSARAALASWAVEQLKARQAARMACARARAAAGRLSGVEEGRLSGLIDARAPAVPAAGSSATDARK